MVDFKKLLDEIDEQKKSPFKIIKSEDVKYDECQYCHDHITDGYMEFHLKNCKQAIDYKLSHCPRGHLMILQPYTDEIMKPKKASRWNCLECGFVSWVITSVNEPVNQF